MAAKRSILLLQLPIPPLGPQRIAGNVPLAAGYLKLFARRRGLEADYDIGILPPPLANTLSDQGLVEEMLARQPWMVGFTCYVWNIDRTLWIAERLKARRPEMLIIVGGPEITADNAWVLKNPSIDFAAIGEGEQTFAELLTALRDRPNYGHRGNNGNGNRSSVSNRNGSGNRSGVSSGNGSNDGGSSIPNGHLAATNGVTFESPNSLPTIAGLYTRSSLAPPPFRSPLPQLNEVSSPYLEGILDAADEEILLLETVRGCIFKCKFCYYPKSYDSLYWVDEDHIVANLRHASERRVREVVLLDPTLNQRRDFAGFVKLLIRCNPGQRFTYFGELRAEGITPEIGKLLREANFTEVEIGLQSVEPRAQELMDRKNHRRAFERGVQSLLDAGISVKVDLIAGLPGDTVESVRHGIEYLKSSGLYSTVQIFNLSILPGTAFRQEAESLGLRYQPRPPYYVLETPTLKLPDLYQLIQETQDAFDIDFDPFPQPRLAFEERGTIEEDEPVRSASAGGSKLVRCCRVDLDQLAVDSAQKAGDANGCENIPDASHRSQAFTLWFSSSDFRRKHEPAAEVIRRAVADNPHGSLQIVLEPKGDPQNIEPAVLQSLLAAAYSQSNYLDRYYSVHPSGLLGSKRLVVLLSADDRQRLPVEWIQEIGQSAALVWRGPIPDTDELDVFEHVLETADSPQA